jgi:serine/threonine-protein kinase
VKPGNVLIGTDGRVKVVDFGIARAIAEAQVTLPGMTLGSVHYFSPEQARGEPATTASDIYSLGIVLYEMLTGVRPWEGDSAASVALARLTGPIPDPAAVRPSIPADLAAITRKALALDPNDRWPSAAVMADALEATLAPGGGAAIGAAAAGVAGAAAAGVAGAAAADALSGATVISATARPNPAGIPYVPDAYVGADDGLSAGGALPPSTPRRRAAAAVVDEEQQTGTSPLVWLAGILAIILLAAIAFLVFQLASGGGKAPVGQVTVPTLVGLDSTTAAQKANALGLTLTPTSQVVASGQVAGTVLTQDPAPGTLVDKGSAVKITVATAVGTVPVPDLKNKDEPTAVQAIFTAGLTVGVRSEDYDPLVPIGLVVRQTPTSGILVTQGTPVDYVISKGPLPTPSPTPSPTPTPPPTPTPTPTPTPPPTPTPTPTPTPKPTPKPTPTPTPVPTPSPS